MHTQTPTQFLRIVRAFFWVVCIVGLPTAGLAAESPSFRLYDEFPNYGDRMVKTSQNFRMNEDGLTWFTENTRSPSFVIQSANIAQVTGGSTGGTGGAGSTGGTSGGGSEPAPSGGGRRPLPVVSNPVDPEKPTNTPSDIPKTPGVKLPTVSPPAAPAQAEQEREREIADTLHAAAPELHVRNFDVVGRQIPSPVAQEDFCPPPGMHGAAFDHVQACSCGSAPSCCVRIVSYLGYLKWVLLILLLVCADLLAIVILLIGKVRLLEKRVQPASHSRKSPRKKA